MHRTLRWQLYVVAYTFLFGLPLLLAPEPVVPLLGFQPTREPWARLVGMFLLALSYISFIIWRQGISSMLPHSMLVRAFFSVVLLVMALSGNPPFLYVMSGIVMIGVLGPSISYLVERRTYVYAAR